MGAKRTKEEEKISIFIHFKFSQSHARYVCLPTNIFVLQNSVHGSGMFLNLLQKRKRLIIHGRASFFAFPAKAQPLGKKVNRTM